MAKSSQVGLHVWLPMAMEGPTPVSALIHAATMVTAGVYLLMRTSPLIEYSSTVLILCLWVGAITTVFSSLIGLFQQDIKKVIAYSTMSQLGMMIIAIGLSSYNIALYHLVNHAFYKGLLFLGAGAVIHAIADNQDFRKYGGLRPFLPLTYSVMLIASLSLVAFPFMTGFYSKDFILESGYGQFYFSSIIVYFIATIGAMFTTLYSIKVLYLTFITNPNGPIINYKQAHEGDIFMSLPLIILAIFSIFFGYITKEIFIGLGSNFFVDNSLFIHPLHEIALDTEFAVPTLFKLLPLIFTIVLSIISIVIFEYLSKLLIIFKFSSFGYNIFSFFNQRFLIELFYNKYVVGFILKLGGHTTKVIDKGSVELLGPYGLEKGLLKLSKSIASLDTGVITSYALYILVGLIFYILIPYLSLTDNSLLLLILFGLFSIKKEKFINYKPKPHTFVNVVVHSDFDLKIMIKNIREKVFNKKNIITILIMSLLIFSVRYVLFYLEYTPNISFILIYFFKGIKAIINSIENDFNTLITMDMGLKENSFKGNQVKELKNLHINFMDRPMLDRFQQIPILGTANPDNRMNQWTPGSRPKPGSVTSVVEDLAYTPAEKLEWIKFMQEKRKEIYMEEPILKTLNLDFLDKKSNIAEHKLKELSWAQRGLEQWQKNGENFWNHAPDFSVRRLQQNSVQQLININAGLGRSLTADNLLLSANDREQYLRVNKRWSETFDGFHKDQLDKPYFPEESSNQNSNQN